MLRDTSWFKPYVMLMCNIFFDWHKNMQYAPLLRLMHESDGNEQSCCLHFDATVTQQCNLTSNGINWHVYACLMLQLSEVNLLFIDNPVGTGYSYVDSDKAYTTDVQQIAADLLSILKVVMKVNSELSVSVFSLGYSVIRVVCHQGSLSLAYSVIRVACHQGGLSLGWSVNWVVSH